MKIVWPVTAAAVVIVGAIAVGSLGASLVPSPSAVSDGIVTQNASLFGASALSSASATKFKNCTALNKKYPHGVGKPGAVDKVRGSTAPVTTFTVSASLYKANKKSDRDKDGIACEKL